jgi:Ni,Fe-hydrogenase III component G
MNADSSLELGARLVEEWTLRSERPDPDRLDVFLRRPEDLLPAVAALRVKRLGYLAAITGLDHGPQDGLEVLYHFPAGAAVITLRLPVAPLDPRVPSLCDLIPSAAPHERELAEMFGITVEGIPNPKRLYISDDWPEKEYPLRKAWQPTSATGHTAEGGDE